MRAWWVSALLVAVTCAGCKTVGRNMKPLLDPVPEHWAHPVKAEGCKGYLVFLKRNDQLYNSSQPSPDHFKAFAAMGIKAVVNLRCTHSDEKVVETLGMKYYSIPVPAWGNMDPYLVKFLKIAADPANQPL